MFTAPLHDTARFQIMSYYHHGKYPVYFRTHAYFSSPLDDGTFEHTVRIARQLAAQNSYAFRTVSIVKVQS